MLLFNVKIFFNTLKIHSNTFNIQNDSFHDYFPHDICTVIKVVKIKESKCRLNFNAANDGLVSVAK